MILLCQGKINFLPLISIFINKRSLFVVFKSVIFRNAFRINSYSAALLILVSVTVMKNDHAKT